MSRATPDDQLKFLLSCVRHSNNGKIDFVEVARECGVVSKGAAAKRYERLLKANGIHPNGGPSDRPVSLMPKPKSRTDAMKLADAKRRKIEGDCFRPKADDEEDVKPYFKPEPFETHNIKSEPDIGMQPHSWHSVGNPTLQPFFPRPLSTQPIMRYPHPFNAPHPALSYDKPNRFPYPFQQPVQPPTPRPILQSNYSPPEAVPDLVKPIVNSSSPLISEEQLDIAFDEFCREDLFKQPSFNTNHDMNLTAVTKGQANQILVREPQLSPRTVDATAAISLSNPPMVDVAEIYSRSTTGTSPTTAAIITAAPTAGTVRPDGTGIENSILIADE